MFCRIQAAALTLFTAVAVATLPEASEVGGCLSGHGGTDDSCVVPGLDLRGGALLQRKRVKLARSLAPAKRASAALNFTSVGWRWPDVMRGGELHREITGVVARDPNHAFLGFKVLEQLVPDPRDCQCHVVRWDQYAVCADAMTRSTRALSLGVNGYDPWGQELQRLHAAIKPQLYDCFNLQKPTEFDNDFYPQCVGAQANAGEIDGRHWTTLPALLAGAANATVLLKMDIETHEFPVLETLGDEDFARIGSLNVEYHFNAGECPTEKDLYIAESVFQRVRKHMAVVDAAAAYYDQGCPEVGGIRFPNLIAASYASRSLCDS